MRVVTVFAMPLVVAVGVIAGLGSVPSARATEDGWGINGTYAALSNGEWAMTNERYQDAAVVRSTWTVTTTCTSRVDCAGTVSSDQGWSAPIYTTSGLWYVKREIADWQKCPDGTVAPGLQVFRFSAKTGDSMTDLWSTDTLGGEDETTGPSGACGKSQWLIVRMPFRLNKITWHTVRRWWTPAIDRKALPARRGEAH